MDNINRPNSWRPFDLDHVRIRRDRELLFHLVHSQLLFLRAYSRLIRFVLRARKVVRLKIVENKSIFNFNLPLVSFFLHRRVPF